MPTVAAKPLRTARQSPAVAGKIRAELNLEKWPGVWQPSKSKNEDALRVLEREVQSDDGSKMVSRVEIGYTHLGTLTTEERKMYGALIEIWEDNGKPADRPVFFSDRLLARILNKGWGTNVRDSIVKSLRKLRTVPIEWINSYYQKTDEGKMVLRERTPFTILSDLKIVEKEVDGVVNNAMGFFRPDDRILKNLLANFTKPLLLDVMVNFKSDIAVLLYSHVDLMLARKDIYERRSKELFADLGLTNPEYSRQHERYRAVKKSMAELVGVRLSTGVLKIAKIEKTIDGKDYKTVFRKVAASEIVAMPAVDEALPVVVNHYAKAGSPDTNPAEAVVRQFHLVVHGVDSHEPQSKELSQALTLIGQYGFEKVMYLVGYAAEQAKRTNFSMQHFGAVLNYASRASADFDRANVNAPAVLQPSPSRTVPEENKWTTGLRRLAILTPQQQQERFEITKAALFAENPFLAGHWKEGSGIQEKLIRARVVRDLETEPMEITAPGFYDWLPSVVRPTSFQEPKTTDSVVSKSAL